METGKCEMRHVKGHERMVGGLAKGAFGDGSMDPITFYTLHLSFSFLFESLVKGSI